MTIPISELKSQYLKHIETITKTTQNLIKKLGKEKLLISAGELSMHLFDDQSSSFQITPIFHIGAQKHPIHIYC